MHTFLKRLEIKIDQMEKYWEEEVKRNQSLNQFLYDYELNSILSYGETKAGPGLRPELDNSMISSHE